jgi:hypothetical protein
VLSNLYDLRFWSSLDYVVAWVVFCFFSHTWSPYERGGCMGHFSLSNTKKHSSPAFSKKKCSAW